MSRSFSGMNTAVNASSDKDRPARRRASLVKKAALSVLLFGIVVAGAGPASAQGSSAQRFTAYFVVDPGSAQPRLSVVVASGVVNDVGTVEFGGDDALGLHHDTLNFRRGDVDLAAVADDDQLSFDSRTCTGTATETGRYWIRGTGGYAGLHGRGTWVNRAVLIAPWAPDCSLDQAVAYVVFTANGRASLAS